MSKVAIIKYNAGNVYSVKCALTRLGVEPLITSNPDEIKTADKVIFPGVGEASSAMRFLRENHLDQMIVKLTQPTLGICLGLQLMCENSEENDTECLGIFPVKVKKFVGALKIPQIGWNSITSLSSNLFKGLDTGYCYFVHSYYAELSEYTISKTNYIQEFSSALKKDNFYAVQFHPEKSADTGAKILENFLTC